MDLLFRRAAHSVKKIHICWWVLCEQKLYVIDVHMHAVPEGVIRVSQHMMRPNDNDNLPTPVPLHHCKSSEGSWFVVRRKPSQLSEML